MGLSSLVIVSIVIGIIYLSYWLPKRFGKRKLGLWISGILTTGMVVLIFAYIFDDVFFFKSDVVKKLSEHSFELQDDFKITRNESGGFKDYYHQFEITISPQDKERLITQIVTSENYQESTHEMFDIRYGKPRNTDRDTSFTANYQDDYSYRYQFFKPNKPGYKPTWDLISVSKTKNKLFYLRIID